MSSVFPPTAVAPLHPSAGALSPDGVSHAYTWKSPAHELAGMIAPPPAAIAASASVTASGVLAVRLARFDIHSNTDTIPTSCRSAALYGPPPKLFHLPGH